MTTGANLWAIGYDNREQANRARDVISRLGWDLDQAGEYSILLDIAVAVRHPDGSFTLDREPPPGGGAILAFTLAGFFAGLVLAAPLIGAAVGALLGSAATAATRHIGIDDEFIREVEGMMKPGAAVLFVLEIDVDLDVILHTIHGLGGKILKTNVDLERARLSQTALLKQGYCKPEAMDTVGPLAHPG
jgi:uncharacterized membrane protein